MREFARRFLKNREIKKHLKSIKGGIPIARVGLGEWGKELDLGLLKTGHFVITRSYSPDEKENQDYARRMNCEASNFKDILHDQGIQAVVIASPNQCHKDQAIAAIESGKHVFVEKPMALTIEDCKAMITAAQIHRKTLWVGHNFKYDGRISQLVDLMPEIGKLKTAKGIFTSQTGKKLEGTWRENPENLPAAPLMQLGIHLIDVFNSFFGNPETVQAQITNNEGLEIDETIDVNLEYPNDIIANIHTSYVEEEKFSIELTGENGVILMTWKETLLNGIPVKQEQEDSVKTEFEIFQEVMELNNIQSAKEAMQNVRIVLAAIKSAEAGKKIKLL